LGAIENRKAKPAWLCALFLVCALALHAQTGIERNTKLPGIRRFHRISLDAKSLADAARAGVSVAFPIAGQWHQLQLSLHSLRAPGFRAVLITPEGEREIEPPPVSTYRGKLDGDPGSEVRLTISGDSVRGFAAFGTSWYFIEPEPGGGHIAYSAADAESLATLASDALPGRLAAAMKVPAGTLALSTPLTATIILDADAEFYTLDPASWMARQESVLNDVEGIYSAEVQVQFRVRLQAAHTNLADFPGTTACTSTAQDLLAQVNNYWGARPEGRDLVHVFSGKNFDNSVIGCAYEPSLADNAQSASLSQQVSKGANATYTATALQKALLAAHEIGHTFNGDHNWATSTYDAACQCTDDTIMSPIFSGTTPLPGGHQMVNHFSDANKLRIDTTAQNSLCTIPAGNGDTSAAGSAIIDDFYRNGGVTFVGCPTDNLHASGNGSLQDVSGGTQGAGALLIASGAASASWLYGMVWTYYSQAGGAAALGFPQQDEQIGTSYVSGASIFYATLPNAAIYSYGTGPRYGQTYRVGGAIATKWAQACVSNCGTGAVLGMPTAEEAAAGVSPNATTGRMQTFEAGQIYLHQSGPRTGLAYFVHADISLKYTLYGGSASALGFPISDEYSSGSGLRSDFEGGSIVWTSSGGAVVNLAAAAETISKPTLPQGAGRGVEGSVFTFTAGGAVSSKGSAVRYKFFWGDGSDSGWLAAGATSAAKSWASTGSYAVTAIAANSDLSVLSAPSDPLMVAVGPAAPVLSAPANGAAGVATNVSLTWSAVAGTSGYSVYFGTTNPPPLAAVVSGTTFTPALSAGVTYYWTAASRDPNNSNSENPAAVWSFGTAGATTPIGFSANAQGAMISVDGVAHAVPFTLNLTGGNHSVSVAAGFQAGAGVQYSFTSWSDATATPVRTITVSPGQPAAYSASFLTQYQLLTASNPAGGGSVSPASGDFYPAGSTVAITATAASGYAFASWTGSVSSSSNASSTIVMTAPQTVSATFVQASTISFQSSPPGLPIVLDGGSPQTTPFSAPLTAGSHTISVAASIPGVTGTQYVFNSWADNNTNASRTIVVGGGGASSYSANFTTQYQLTTAASPTAGGAVTPSTGFFNAGATVTVTAAPSAGYAFGAWSSNVTSGAVSMTGPQTVTATFLPLTAVGFQTSPAGLPVTVDGVVQNAPFTANLTPGSHSIGVPVIQSGGPGTQYVFGAWNDATATATRTVIVVAGQAAAYIAAYNTLFQLMTAASPPSGGIVAPASAYFNAGQAVPLSATPMPGYAFTGWSPNVAADTVVMTGPQSVTANFSQVTGITFQTNPPGLQVTVDGAMQPSPFNLALIAGNHSASVGAQQPGGAGMQYLFSAWADGVTTTARTVAVVTGQPATYTANYTTQYLITVAASPQAGGSVSGGGYFNSGTVEPISATPNAGYVFTGWTGSVAQPASRATSVTVNAPQTVTANFAAVAAIAFQTNPSGLPLTVDGVTQNAPFTATLTPGPHTIAAPAPAASNGIQNVFASWSDSGAQSHTISLSAGQTGTVSANFTTQYQLIVSVSPAMAGSVSPASGWHNAGSSVQLTATPAPGYTFVNWTGTVSASATASTTIAMNAPQVVSANFSASAITTATFVRQLYRDLLDREPDAAGLAYWSGQLDYGVLTRAQLAAQFFTSAEFASSGLYIVKLYLGVLQRDPDYGGWFYWFNALHSGTPASAVVQNFVSSQEFVQRYGTLSNTDFVTLVYQNLLGRAPDQAGLQYFVGLLNGGATQGQIFDQFVQSAEFGARVAPRANANLLYLGLLRRTAEPGGLAYWTSSLAAGNPLASGVGAFIGSPEYLSRLALVNP
jgi:uncharacterized repeat protein (TIGR02543 family)